MKKVDGELTPAEAEALSHFIDNNPQFAREMQTFEQLKKETNKMKTSVMPELAWEDYWQQLYNRLERAKYSLTANGHCQACLDAHWPTFRLI